MKLTIVLSLLTCLQVSARNGYAQMVTLSERNAPLEKVFREIRKQTDYLFLYTKEMVQNAKKVDIVAKNVPVEEVLAICFKGQDLEYSIVERTVIIKKPVEKTREVAPLSIVVQGTITDSLGRPLVGVSILVKGTKTQTISDANGNFKISVPSAGSVLVFTSVGYRRQEVVVGSQSNIAITLFNDPKELNEIVVTGFGDRSKRNVGYATTTVSGDAIRSTGAINPIAALQGMVPGMQVQPGIGGPQSTPRFLIRGSASLNPYGNQPLIVVDDIIMDQDVVIPNKGGDRDFGNILKDLNPDDIESVTVLKGGAVTALYGSRASNGVILIRTKKGFSQRGLGVSVSQSLIWDQPYKTADFQNVYGSGLSTTDFIKDANGQLQINPDTYGYNFGPPMTGQTVLDVTGKVIQNNPRPHNVLDVFRTGLTSNTNAGISGGNEKGTFRISFSRLASEAVTPNNKFDRNSISFRGTQRVLNKVFLDANMSYVRSIAYNPADQGSNGIFRQFVYGGTRNYDTKYWMSHYIDSARGGVNTNDPTGSFNNAFFSLFQNNIYQTENNFRGSLDVKAQLVKGLEFQGTASVNYYGQNYEEKRRGQDSGFYNPYYGTSIRNVTVSRYRGNLNYTPRIDDFNFLLQAGGEINTSSSKKISSNTNGGGILPDVYRLSNSPKPVTTTEDAPNKIQIASLFFQGSVAFRDFLTLNIYGRNDWNSTLVYNDGHGKYSYFYPGADVAWIFSDAFKGRLPRFIDYGKLRLSFASAGAGTDAYTANTGAYTAGQPYTDRLGNSVINYAYRDNTLPNQNLIPQRTNKFEAGLEFKMFQNRLGADIAVYTQQTAKQIISFGTPITSGVNAAIINNGIVRNRGLELYIYGTPVRTRNFSWDTYFNYTLNRNTVVSLPFGLQYVNIGGGDGYQVVAKVGGDYGTLTSTYGYAHYQATDGAGKPIASPLNGKPVIRQASVNTAVYVRAQNYTEGTDKQPKIGSITPKFLGNWRNTFSYKQFQLSVALDSKIGGMEYSFTEDLASWLGSMESTLPYRTKDRGGIAYTNAAGTAMENGVIMDAVYQKGSSVKGLDGQTHDLSGMTMKQAYDNGWIRPTAATSYYMNTHSWANGIRESAMFTSSWVSLQQVAFTYELPYSLAAKLKLNGLRLSLLGNNLLYIYNSAKDHINPNNLNDSGSGAVTESSGMPYIRSFGFSLNGSF
ncbi:MAG: SusC/RagA family TonB-linked outer membrane protein [Chitinophagaceae bacterium]|nr:SusC/RagA family TonB-linked outer membrane protein [Chitinophagaceae bacterium]